MTGTLILVRHGESAWNAANRFTGRADPPLTARGKAQARTAGRLLAARLERPPQGIFTSALQRAETTLQLVLAELDASERPYVRDPRLNERDYGDLTGLNKAESAARFGVETVRRWRRAWEVAPPNGESLRATSERVLPFYRDEILPGVLRGEAALVVAHGNSLRAVVMELEGLSPRSIESVSLATAQPWLYRLAPDGAVESKQVLG